MHETRTAPLGSRPPGIGQPCAICDWIDLQRHDADGAALESDWAAPSGCSVFLCRDHRYEVNRLLEKERPGVTPGNVHLVYCQLYRARRGGRLKRFGEIVSSLPDVTGPRA